jgi:hypothetical protein
MDPHSCPVFDRKSGKNSVFALQNMQKQRFWGSTSDNL